MITVHDDTTSGDAPDRAVTAGERPVVGDADEAVRAAAESVEIDLELIVAVAANEVIGADGEIPWHLPADLQRFKRLTTGHPVIMGRRTYDSILAQVSEPLPDRTSVVCSRSAQSYPPGAVRVESLPAAIRTAAADAASRGVDRAFVAGGATVYRGLFPVTDRMHRTELTDAYEGDTRFPAFDRDEWTVTERDEREGFAFVTYERG